MSLSDELYETRLAVIEAIGNDELRKLVGEYGKCIYSGGDPYRWWYDLADKIVAKAIIIPRASHLDRFPDAPLPEDRAMCPLCNHGGSQPYVTGYKIPSGLRDHLVGSGRASKCSVMKVVLRLAVDCDVHKTEMEKRMEGKS